MAETYCIDYDDYLADDNDDDAEDGNNGNSMSFYNGWKHPLKLNQFRRHLNPATLTNP